MNPDALRPLTESPKNIRPPFDQYRPEQPFDTNTERWRAAQLADQRAAIMEALEGVELSDYDRRMIDHFANWDTPTIGFLTSLLYRTRQAGRDTALG